MSYFELVKIVECKFIMVTAIIKFSHLMLINFQMCAKTTIAASPDFKETKFWLNGELQSIDTKRIQNCLRESNHRLYIIMKLFSHAFFSVKNKADPNLECLNWHLRICSENNFPTAAGLASSAAGYACLVYALAQIYEVKTNISSVARVGSGSACRSVFGGWV